MRIDVNAFLGAYPFRRVPGTSPEALLEAMDRTGVDEAWVTHLPGDLLARSCTRGTRGCSRRRERIAGCGPCPRCIPRSRSWEEVLRAAADGRRTGGPLRSDLLRHRTRRAGHARAGGCLRSRGAAADARRAARGRAPAAPPRPCGRAARRRGARAGPERLERPPRGHARRPAVHRGGALRLHARGGAAHLVGHLLDLGPAGGPPRDPAADGRRRAIRLRHRTAAPDPGERRGQARSARSRRRGPGGDRVRQCRHGRRSGQRPAHERTRRTDPVGTDPRGAGAVPRRPARWTGAARVRPVDGGAARRRRGGVGPYRAGSPPERGAAARGAGDLARGAARPGHRRRRARHHHGDRGAARAGRCAARLSRRATTPSATTSGSVASCR